MKIIFFNLKQLTYDTTNQTRAGVEQILSDCKYMQNKMTYYAIQKERSITLNKTGIEHYYGSSKRNIILGLLSFSFQNSPRARNREQAILLGGTWTGKDEEGNSYKGYYNYFNWGAFEAILY